MKNRIEYQEGIQSSIERIPFLKRFTRQVENDSGGLPYVIDGVRIFDFIMDSQLINEYMGYEYLKKRSSLTSESINKVLEEAEKRGDL
jgi:Mor family transcriptional regulator